jgi:hypothetical protein
MLALAITLAVLAIALVILTVKQHVRSLLCSSTVGGSVCSHLYDSRGSCSGSPVGFPLGGNLLSRQ